MMSAATVEAHSTVNNSRYPPRRQEYCVYYKEAPKDQVFGQLVNSSVHRISSYNVIRHLAVLEINLKGPAQKKVGSTGTRDSIGGWN